MGKYLHRFTTLESFNEAYGDSASTLVTAFTCSAGTFVYDRYDETGPVPVYIWKKEDKELITYARNPKVGPGCEKMDQGAYDPDEEFPANCIEITAVSTIEHDTTYKEPWVSYTTYEKDTEFSGDWWYYDKYDRHELDQYKGPCTLVYKGEVDWEDEFC